MARGSDAIQQILSACTTSSKRPYPQNPTLIRAYRRYTQGGRRTSLWIGASRDLKAHRHED